MKRMVVSLFILTAFFGGIVQGVAATVGYNTQAFFLAAAGTAPRITLRIDLLNFTADAGPFTQIVRTGYRVTTATPILIKQNFSEVCAGGARPTTGCISVGSLPTAGVTFTFATPQRAFGLLVTKASIANIARLTFTVNGRPLAIRSNFARSAWSPAIYIGFFGVIDRTRPFTSVRIAPPAAGNQIGFDNVQIGR